MFMEMIRNRRSVRQFEDRPVPAAAIAEIVEAALRSPSSRGLMPWHFVVVTDPQRLAAVSRAKPHGASFLKDAPLGIAVCADPAICDVWIEDASIATTYIQLAAEAHGLGSCWIQFRQRQDADGRPAEANVRDALGVPGSLNVLSVVAIGYPSRRPAAHGPDTLLAERVHREAYGQAFGG